jgi:hypothetical protein
MHGGGTIRSRLRSGVCSRCSASRCMGSLMQQLMVSRLGSLTGMGTAMGMRFTVGMQDMLMLQLPGMGHMGNSSRRMCT